MPCSDSKRNKVVSGKRVCDDINRTEMIPVMNWYMTGDVVGDTVRSETDQTID